VRIKSAIRSKGAFIAIAASVTLLASSAEATTYYFSSTPLSTAPDNSADPSFSFEVTTPALAGTGFPGGAAQVYASNEKGSIFTSTGIIGSILTEAEMKLI
jgi:hypothetical protein